MPDQPRDWDLEPGDKKKRKDLHDQFGGERQSGVAPSNKTPNVFIFTDPEIGGQYGYRDHWEGEVFCYYGKGKPEQGNQTMEGGNLRILKHRENGDAIRLFQGVKGTVTYLGEFEILDDPPYKVEKHTPTGTTQSREVIVFRLRRVRHARVPTDSEPAREYRPSDESPTTASANPFERDPNAIDRALASHARLQNALHAFLKARHIRSWSPGAEDPDFDLGWIVGTVYFVTEVKSLPQGAETKQLRLGLGQVLDYHDTLRERFESVQPVLVVERPPTERRWVELCDRHGVRLVWPKTFGLLL